MPERTAELGSRLAALEARVGAACAAAGRPRSEVTVIVVTKTWPADDVRRLSSLGVVDVAENRDQEAKAKAQDCADLDLRWHFVGSVQSNKAGSLARYVDVVHSVDRESVVEALSRGAERAQRELAVLVQVSLDPPAADGAAGRGGVAPEDVRRLADLVAKAPGLQLRGVMGVAPRPPAAPEDAFATLARVAAEVRAEHGDATWISAGMSGDLEQAVAAGATHLRVGTAVLGSRPLLR